MSNIIKKGIAVLKSPKKRTIILAQHGFFKNMSDEEFLKMQFIFWKKVRPTQTMKFFPIYCLPWKKQVLYPRLSQIQDFFLILWLLT